MTDIKERIAQQRELRLHMRREKERRVAQRLRLLKLIRQEKWRLINAKHEERYEQIRQKCELARSKVIEATTERKRKERARAKAREKQVADTERQKREDAEGRCVHAI